MNNPRTFTGKNVDEATEDALEALGVELEDVEIKVISPGRSGILGFGGEPAVIEVTPSRDATRSFRPQANVAETETAEPAPRAERAEPAERTEQTEPAQRAERAQPESGDGAESRDFRRTRGRRDGEGRGRGGRRGGGGRSRSREPRADAAGPATASAEARPEDRPEVRERETRKTTPVASEPRERDVESEQMVAELLDYFLSSMGVVAETFVRDELEEGSLVFEIEGEDAGLLIGRRGETLQALQFLVRMIVNRQLGRKAFVIIDVEDYRRRRSEMLGRLARRTAGGVASSGRASALEPMSPGERRIVHMSLANHPEVRTESEGEGNDRHVVVIPRR